MLLNLAVVLLAIAGLYVVRKRVDLEPMTRNVLTVTIIGSVLLWLIIGAAPR